MRGLIAWCRALPSDFILPPGGLNIRPHDPVLAQEMRLQT